MTIMTIQENKPNSNKVLDKAKDKLKTVLIIGLEKDTEKLYFASNTSNNEKLLNLANSFKQFMEKQNA